MMVKLKINYIDSEEEEEVSGFKEIKDIELSVCLLSDTLNIRDPYA